MKLADSLIGFVSNMKASAYMKHDYIILVAAFALFVACAQNPSSNSTTPQPFEPDNTIGTAHPIATDSTAQNRTITTDDIDWISFYAPAGDIYLIAASTGVINELYDPTGTTVLDSGTQISWQSPETGIYFICIKSHGGYAGAYDIAVSTSGVDCLFISALSLT